MTQPPEVTINIRICDTEHKLTIEELRELRDMLNRLLPPEPEPERISIEHIPQDWHPPDSIYCESTDEIIRPHITYYPHLPWGGTVGTYRLWQHEN